MTSIHFFHRIFYRQPTQKSDRNITHLSFFVWQMFLEIRATFKGIFFSESAMCFSNLQMPKYSKSPGIYRWSIILADTDFFQ